MKKQSLTSRSASLARERLRRRYRPADVRILFVGESPPASGRFFYRADSGLYRAIRDAFEIAFPGIKETDFLASFQALGCYLVDLCGIPVDRMEPRRRKRTCQDGELRLSRVMERLRPKCIVTVVRSIEANVRRSRRRANWDGNHLELPYPGRWLRHRVAFTQALVPVLAKELSIVKDRQMRKPNGRLRTEVTGKKYSEVQQHD
ncbi:MAG: hypothetical protein HY010_02580 [Acidobacteria bacterium]|nr:hypothetical protein [Acidobacteriota bacterium]